MAARGIYHDLLQPPLEGKGYDPIAGSLGTPPVHLRVFPKIEDRPEAEPGASGLVNLLHARGISGLGQAREPRPG